MVNVIPTLGAFVVAVLLAVAVFVGPFAVYRITRNWTDTTRAAVFLWLVSIGAVLNVVLVPRNLLMQGSAGEGAEAIASAAAEWNSRAVSLMLIGFALAVLLTAWQSRDKSRRKDPVWALGLVLVLYYFLNIIAGATVAAAANFEHKSLYIPIVLGALISLRHVELTRLIGHIKWMLGLVMALSVIAALVYPEFALLRPYAGQVPGVDFRLYGITAHANALGPIALLLLIFELHTPSRALLRWPLLGLALANVVLAQSKTVWLSAFVVAAVAYLPYRLILLQGRTDGYASTSKWALILIVGLAGGIVALMNADMSRVFSGEVLSLTGRTDIWADTLAEFQRYPLFGYGPDLWGIDYRIRLGKVYAGHAHNQFIQTLGESGLIGFILLLAYLAVLLSMALLSFRFSKGLSLTLYVLVLIRCVTEVPLHGVINDWTFFMHAILLIVLAAYARRVSMEQGKPGSDRAPKPGRRTKLQGVNGV